MTHHSEDHTTPTNTQATQAQLKANKVPIAWRDTCSALLLPLNVCRKDNYYLPWECEHEKHAYEQCQWDDYVRRMKALSKLKKEQAENE